MNIVEITNKLPPLKNAIQYVFDIRIALWDNNRSKMQYRSAQIYCNGDLLFTLPMEPSLRSEIIEHAFMLLEQNFAISKDWLWTAMNSRDKCNGFVTVGEIKGSKEFCRCFGK